MRPKDPETALLSRASPALNYAEYVGNAIPQPILQARTGGLYHDVFGKDNLFR